MQLDLWAYKLSSNQLPLNAILYIKKSNCFPCLNCVAGHEAVAENAHLIVNCLIGLVDYPHKTVL